MRILVEYDMDDHDAIRKWVQRHPEASGVILRCQGYAPRTGTVIFDVNPHDINTLGKIYYYLSTKRCRVYNLKEINPSRVLSNYVILSIRPFKAVSKSEASRILPGVCPTTGTQGGERLSEVLENVRRSADTSQEVRS